MLTGLGIQSDLLAQDLDQWGDILVLVVMAILWLAGGLAKVITARKGAPQDRQQKTETKKKTDRRETWQERLARRAQEFQRAAEAKARDLEQAATGTTQKTPHKKSAPPPQPPAGKIRIRHGASGDSVIIYEHPSLQPAMDRNMDAARHDEVQRAVVLASEQIVKPQPPKFMTEPLTKILSPSQKPATVAAAAAEQAAGFHPDDLIDYSDPDALKKAVLHCEILGKPLGLREPTEGTSPF